MYGFEVAVFLAIYRIFVNRYTSCPRDLELDALRGYLTPRNCRSHVRFQDREQIQSQVADIKNIGDGRWGGAITAAKFLEEFVAEKPWTHIDIAGPAFADKPKNYIDAGASGCMVRTLTKLIESM